MTASSPIPGHASHASSAARSPSLERAAWAALALLVTARIAVSMAPTMWVWGWNAPRFLAPGLALLLLVTQNAALFIRVPGLGAERVASERVGSSGLRLAALAAVGASVLVWLLPDRTWFTGDFFLRQGIAESGSFADNFRYALPLERLLDQFIPARIGEFSRLDPNLGSRVVGALLAATLAATSVALPRAWGFGGMAAVVAGTIVFFGGALTLFTGLAKPAGAVAVLAAIEVLALTKLAREGRGGALAGVVAGLALLTHRSALALLPPLAFGVALAARGAGGARAPRREIALALALPLAAAALAAPRIWTNVAAYDLGRHLAPEGANAAGVLAALIAPLRLLDLANVTLFYVPLLPIAALLGAVAGRRAWSDPDRGIALALALGSLPVLLLIQPLQGAFRDLDVFAIPGIALALLAAHVVGAALRQAQVSPRFGAAAAVTGALAALAWILHFHDPIQGLKRARAFATEAPARPRQEMAALWDAIAYRAIRLGQWPIAVEASEQAVARAPHPRSLLMLAIARTYAGQHARAQALYRDLSARYPEDPLVWLGLWGESIRVGDTLTMARAYSRLERYAPGSREARLIRKHLQFYPEVLPKREEVGLE